MNTDPWQNRSKTMRCNTCIWFVPKVARKPKESQKDGEPLEFITEVSKLGRCRRHAPTLGGYPAVFISDWCGDHKLNENVVS